MAEESLRERYNARDPRSQNGQLHNWLRQETQNIQRGIPWPSVTIDMRDLVQPGRDFAEALTKAVAAMPDTGGVIRFPCMSAAWLLDGNGATLASPKRGVSISKNNVWIVGDGDTPIHMANWDQGDAAGAGADTAGQDVFTCIRFEAAVVGGGVMGFYVTGESDSSALTVGEPRAKFVGVDGAERVLVSNCRGVDIVGNLVCIRGNNTAAGAAGPASYNTVTECYAENCAENGVNYMGGTFDCVFSNNVMLNNEFQGFESGTHRLTCTGNHFIGNTNGMSHVGRHATITGNVARDNEFSGIHMQWNNDANFDASHNVIADNICHNNSGATTGVGILCDGGSHHNLIEGNICRDNGSASAGGGIQLSADVEDTVIEGNFCYDSGASNQAIGINVVDSANITVRNNRTKGNTSFGIAIQSTSDRPTLIGNDGEEATSISIASTVTNVFQRSNRGFSQSNPAQITADQNDYAPTGQWAETWRLTSNASRTITGIANGVQDRRVRVVNAGTQNLVLANQSTSSAAANRIITGTGANYVVAPDDVASLWYDDATDRWRLVSVPDELPPLFAPGSFTVPTGQHRVMAGNLTLSGSESATLEGTAILAIV